MRIKDILFGKKKFFETLHLGLFEARVRNERTAEKITWLSVIKIENYSDEITILLDGNGYNPKKEQLDSVSWIIKNLKTIDNKIIDTINKNPALNEKYKDKNLFDLRLECIYPWDANLNSYELSLQSKSDKEFGISVIIQDKELIEIE